MWTISGKWWKIMEINIVAVGKLKEKYLKNGINEYAKRLGPYTKFKIIEVADEHAPENLSEAEMDQVKDIEGDRILKKIPDRAYVYALDLDGKEWTSEQFSKKIDQNMIQGQSKIYFVIGGSLGLGEKVLNRSDAQMCFGKMTYPHQLMRLILTEQVYRAFKIMKNEPYHK